MTEKEMQQYVVENIFQYLPNDRTWQVKASTNYQNNDKKVYSISISNDGAIFKTVGTSMLCDLYDRGMDIKEIMTIFAEFIVMETPKNANDFAQRIFNFDFVKNKIFATVVHYGCNSKRLEDLVYKREEDLAITYKILVEETDDGMATIPIQKKFLDKWDINIDELHKIAIENTKIIMPVRVYGLQEMTIKLLFGVFGIGNCEDDDFDMKNIDWTNDLMYVVTNKNKQHGAIYMFDYELLSEIAEKMNTNSLYIFPSSIHESIVCNAEALNPDEANQLVERANISGDCEEEILSDHAYLFDLESQTLASL